MTTISLDVELAPAGISREERVALQQGQLARFAHVFGAADQVRLYADEARNFAYARDEKSLHFMADAKREVARGDNYAPPPYDNLMCFFKTMDKAPLDWVASPQPASGAKDSLNPAAGAELREFLEAHPEGCVLSFNMTASRSSVTVFPGARCALAAESEYI